MPLQVFDRINALDSNGVPYKLRSMPFDKYFGEMHLTPEQKKERIALATDLEDVMTFFFYLVMINSQYDYMAAISVLDAKKTLADRMEEIIAKHTEINGDIRKQIDDFVEDVNDVTIEHLLILNALADDAKEEKRKSEEYYLSDDRARLLAEEESNSIFNITDFYKAKTLGFRTKTWRTMKDKWVRKTHERVDDRTIPIDEYFIVGNSLMLYPRDPRGEAKEIIRCRCSLAYHK